jgi:hypothetical protein
MDIFYMPLAELLYVSFPFGKEREATTICLVIAIYDREATAPCLIRLPVVVVREGRDLGPALVFVVKCSLS